MNATDFAAFTAQAAAEVDAIRTNCHLGTPQAPTIEMIEAILTSESIAGISIACVAEQCYYCGTQILPMADSPTGRRPFPHYGSRRGDVCLYGTLVEDSALTADVLI